MRVRIALGVAAAIAISAYAELALAFRTPRSPLAAAGALAAIISFPTGEPDPPKKLAGMYGLFVVRSDAAESIFPFSIVPGDVGSSAYRPDLAQLRERFGGDFPARPDAADDTRWKDNTCVVRPAAEFGFARLTEDLRLRSQALCVVRQSGTRPGAMLISVTL